MLQTPYLGLNISGDDFPEARLPTALLHSLLAAKEQKQDLHEAQSQMFCGRITQLLLPVQNQQLDGAGEGPLQKGPPCQAGRRSLGPLPWPYEFAPCHTHPVPCNTPTAPADNLPSCLRWPPLANPPFLPPPHNL